MNIKWDGWDKAEEGIEIPIVFVLNMDIVKSKELAAETHPIEHHKNINIFQEKVEGILEGMWFYKFDQGFKYLGVTFVRSMVMVPFDKPRKGRKVLYYPPPLNMDAYYLKKKRGW